MSFVARLLGQVLIFARLPHDIADIFALHTRSFLRDHAYSEVGLLQTIEICTITHNQELKAKTEA